MGDTACSQTGDVLGSWCNNAIPGQITPTFFAKIDGLTLKFLQTHMGPRTATTIWKEQNWNINTSWFYNYGNQDSVVFCVRKDIQINGKRTKSPEINLYIYGQLISNKCWKSWQFNRKKQSFHNVLGQQIQKNETEPFSYTDYKNELKMDQKPKCESSKYKTLRRKLRWNHCDLDKAVVS